MIIGPDGWWLFFGGSGWWNAAQVAVFEPVAIAFECDDLDVVDEAVDHGGGHDVVAEHFTPAAERLVGGDDQGGSLVSGGHQLEEQVGRFGFEGDVADLVDDKQRVAAQPDQFRLEPAGVVGLGQSCHPLAGGGEQDAVAGLAGPDGQSDREVGFAGAWSEGDRLQQLRAVLPCEVRVVAETHPLFGRLLAARSFKRWNGALLLVVELPDGSPGTIRAGATDVLGGGVVEGAVSVLDAAGVAGIAPADAAVFRVARCGIS